MSQGFFWLFGRGQSLGSLVSLGCMHHDCLLVDLDWRRGGAEDEVVLFDVLVAIIGLVFGGG